MWFCWCSGYHICLTRRRSQVRHLHRTLLFCPLQFFFVYKLYHRSNERILRGNSNGYIPSKLAQEKESSRHIGLQTDYREESTQTDPYSPTYTISGGGHPEVFALSDFTYGQ